MMKVSESSQKEYGLPAICSEKVYYRTRGEAIRRMHQRIKEEALEAFEREKKKKKGSGKGGPKKKKKH